MSTRGRRGEPHPALQSLLDSPLKLSLSDALTASLETLRQQVKAAKPEEDQVPLYDRAIALTGLLLAELEEQMRVQEALALELPDPAEIRQKRLVAPRKANEEINAKIRANLKRLTQEWTDRLKRQQTAVERQCMDMLDADFKVQVDVQRSAITVGIAPETWNDVTDFTESCLQAWADQACAGADEQLQAALEDRQSAHGAERVPWSPPVAPASPDPMTSDIRKGQDELGTAPSTLGALAMFLRSNLLMVSMFGMMFGAPVALCLGIDLSGGSSGLIRGGMVVAAMPFLIAIGIYTGHSKRKQTIEKITRDSQKKLRDRTTKGIKGELDAHRDRISRWVRVRATEVEQSLEEWWKIAVVPALDEVEAQVAEASQRAKLDHKKLSETHSRLKKTREDVANKLLFDLKRHRRGLAER